MSDYNYVFAFCLTSSQPIVHDGPQSWKEVPTAVWPDGTTKRAVCRTRCGRREIEINYYNEDGSWRNGHDNMTLILGRHAQAMGAHWCRSCFEVPA